MFTLNVSYMLLCAFPLLFSVFFFLYYRTIGMRPVDVTPAIAERLLTTVYNRVNIVGSAKFKVGDSVRVSKY